MKFLLVTHIYPPAVDGGSRVIAKIGEYLTKKGHRIMVLTSNCKSTDDFINPKSSPVNTSVNTCLPAGMGPQSTVHRLPVHKYLRRPLKALRLFMSLFINPKSYIINLLEVFEKGPIFSFFPTIYALRSIISFQPDVIIAGPLPTSIILYARIIRFLVETISAKTPILLINASFHLTNPSFRKKPLIDTLKSSDYIWTLTDYETDFFYNNLNIPHSRMINVGNGIDQSFLINSSKPYNLTPNILYVGSFAAHKNIPLLIDAFRLVASKYPHLTLTLAGQKTLYFPQIQKHLDSLPEQISKRINFIFDFSDNRRTTIYDHATILIQPSVQESFGLTIIEAWARRKAVIASNIPSSIELINKSNGGLIFKQNDSKDLASKIEMLLNDSAKSVKFAQNGYNYVINHYLWDQVTNQLCQNLTS